MNCFYNPNKEAVAQCVDCNKGLCYECSTKYNMVICDECAKARKRERLAYYFKPILITAILFVLFFLAFSAPAKPLEESLGLAYVCSSIYVGWKILSIIFFKVFNIVIGGCIFWFAVLLFGMYIGAFAVPIYVPYCLFQIIRTKLSFR